MKAINTPGVITSVQLAWDTFVADKHSEATHAAMHVYNAIMHSILSILLPCDSVDICKCHETVLGQAIDQLQVETIGICSATTERYLNELMVRSFSFTPCLNIPHSVLWKREKQFRPTFEKFVHCSSKIFVGMNEIFDTRQNTNRTNCV